MVGLIIHGEDEEAEKWVHHHYSSSHEILLVGEGDFSFALSLAHSFGSAFNITATSLDSYDLLTKNYKNAKSNLEALKQLGAAVIHGVDATTLKLHTDLRMRRFDRVVYNFPHAGFYGKEDNVRVIRKHRGLVHSFFRNARALLRVNGEIHVSHKTTAPFSHWNLEELAFQNSLILIECTPFKAEDYPGYNNKRGDGSRCDDPFPLGKCSTFKFIFEPGCEKMFVHSRQTSPRPVLGHEFRCIPPAAHYSPNMFDNIISDSGYGLVSPDSLGHEFRCISPVAHYSPNMFDNINSDSGYGSVSPVSLGHDIRCIPPAAHYSQNMFDDINSDSGYGVVSPVYGSMVSPMRDRFREECLWIFDWYFTQARNTFGLPDRQISNSIEEALSHAYQRFVEIASGRPPSYFTFFLEDIHRLSISRIEWLEGMLASMH